MAKIPISNIYYLLCYAWGYADRADLVDVEELDQLDRVIDLVGKVLAEGTAMLVRRGLDRGYRELQEDLPGIRGKLMVSRMAKRALQARGRSSCLFEDLSHDVIHNRILKSTLQSLLREKQLQREIRDQVRLVYGKLAGIRTIALTRGIFRRVQLDRNRRAYHFLLSICALLQERRLVREDANGVAQFQEFREDHVRMWALFEDFVREFFVREQSQFRVNPRGRGIPWWDREGETTGDEAFIPRMEADVILESQDRRIILDAKFYENALGARGGSRKIRSNNLYQLLAYLRNREMTEPDGPRHEGILLYPVVDGPVRTSVRLEGFRVLVRGIDLTQHWDLIHRDMLGVLDLTPAIEPV